MIPSDSVIYQIVTDRYDNDNGTLHESVRHPNYNEKFKEYLGGTFNGIKRHIDHIQDLGTTHVLLSPVQESAEYHGYHPTKSREVNHRFGSEKDLEKLIEEFHQRNIRVMLDYVTTHVSSSHELFQEKRSSSNPKDREWFLFIDEIESHPKYGSYFDELSYKMTDGHPEEIRGANLHEYLSYFGLVDQPLLNLRNEEVVNWHKENLDYWIRRFGFDDIRFDSGFMQPKLLASEIRDHVKRHGDINLITENWDFEKPGQGCFGLCDGEFDITPTLWFNKFHETPDFFRKIMGHHYRNKHHQNAGYSSILSLDNHDLPRFNGGKDLQKILATLQFTLQSVPLIYYGNEICMQQFNDGRDRVGQSRDPMRFDMWDDDMVEFYKRLVEFRKEFFSEDVELGEFQINDDGKLFSYRGQGREKSFYVVLNAEDRDKPVELDHLFRRRGIKTIGESLSQKIGKTNPSTFFVERNSPYILTA